VTELLFCGLVIFIYKSTIFLTINLAPNYFSLTDYFFFCPTKQLKMLVIVYNSVFFFFFGLMSILLGNYCTGYGVDNSNVNLCIEWT
jgi:hypothetical protein